MSSDAMRLILVAAGIAWIGLALLLSQLRWFSRPSLANRLRPFSPGSSGGGHRAGLLSAESFRDVIAPLAQRSGAALARLFGVSDELDARLRRFHSPLSVAEFRTRQFAWTMAAFGGGLLLAVTVRPNILVALFLVVGPPLLAFLLLEQQVQGQAERWTRRIFLELPIVTEQLGMLLSAGYSLGGALGRLSERSHGAVAKDLRRVTGRIRQGLTEMEALREWADLVDLDALDRLVSVLSLNREAADLGHLISEEARSMRAEAHRELIETIEKRAQMVWIPVTIATLLPGVIFIAIPFTQAMDLFTGTGN